MTRMANAEEMKFGEGDDLARRKRGANPTTSRSRRRRLPSVSGCIWLASLSYCKRYGTSDTE